MPLGYLQVETYCPDGVAINEDRRQQEYARNQQREKSVPAMQPLPGTVKEEPPETDLKKVRQTRRRKKTKSDQQIEDANQKDLRNRNIS